MKRFIDTYNEVVSRCQDDRALVYKERALTYREFDNASGKVYAFLKGKGIGKEDFVQIVLPRDESIPVCIMGVIKAGAAFMLLEDTYPSDRIEYIYKDCSCVLKIDETMYHHIMDNYTPLYGNESTNLHDACYAVYTSGSTGNPKGVLHEYGNIDEAYNSFETWYDEGIINSAIYAPFYFVAGVLDFAHYISRGRTIHIVPHETIRDFAACKKFIEDNNIQEMYMPPSLLRIYNEPAKCLKVIYTGSEPANGLTYNNSPILINFYAMSESGFVVLQKSLDKPNDVAPVGHSSLNHIDVKIIDEDGNVITGPGKGELCFKNDYVRGYINLKEQTNYAFRDGLYHTNDCVGRDENGDYFVYGRFDDMIKINGNRVEPVEIEIKIKELTGLTQVYAKGFTSPSRSYIAVYYLNAEAIEKNLIKNNQLIIDNNKLSRMLPDYMMPTYYVGLDKFPLTATGKVSRKDLKSPKACDYKKDYIAPQTDVEKILCDKMANVLRLDRVSVIDDFYELGGDSMRSMMLVTLCNEAGLKLTSSILYDKRTPRDIAKVCGRIDSSEEMDRIDASAKDKVWPLLPGQKSNVIFGWKSDDINQNNIMFFEELKPHIDNQRLCNAANKVLSAHPGMHIKIYKSEDAKSKYGGYVQRFEPEYKPDCKINKISEEEFSAMSKDIDKPYNLFAERLYRCCIYETEKASYFYYNVHHVISDGSSRKLILDQIANAYNDDNYKVPKDYYFYMLTEKFKTERFEKVEPKGSTANLVKMDKNDDTKEGAVIFRPNIALVDDRREGSFFVAALAMTVAKYNDSKQVIIRETHAGRSLSYSKDIAAEMAIGLMIDVDVTSDKSLPDIQQEIKAQELYEASHPANRSKIDLTRIPGIRFNYQKNTLGNGDFDALIKKNEESLFLKTHNTDMKGTISLNIIEEDGQDHVNALLAYAKGKYDKSNMIKFMDIFEKIVKDNL